MAEVAAAVIMPTTGFLASRVGPEAVPLGKTGGISVSAPIPKVMMEAIVPGNGILAVAAGLAWLETAVKPMAPMAARAS